MNKKRHYIIDFDSTFTQVEALDELARISLKGHPNADAIRQEIANLTLAAMEGKLSFEESLAGRIKLLQANRQHLTQLVAMLKRKVSASFTRNRSFFKKFSDDVFIVSGGFKEFIIPVVTAYHIKQEHVFANTFVFDNHETIMGYDFNNPLSKEKGKVELLKQLKLPGDIYVIGDGYTDFQLKEFGIGKKFFAFTENINRQGIAAGADHVVPNFDEFLFVNKLPCSISYPKNRILCIIIGEVPKQTIDLLIKEGFSVRHETSLTERYVIDVGMLLLSSLEGIDTETLRRARKLKIIGYLGDSRKKISHDLCSELGIAIFDDPKENPNNAKFIPRRMIDFINKGDTYLSCNFPNLQLPKVNNAHRLVHIHRNVPGVMASINQVFACHKINIVGQFLMTNPCIGYVITDISKEYDEKIVYALKKVNHTIKFRVLY